jgi:hypothetical protein
VLAILTSAILAARKLWQVSITQEIHRRWRRSPRNQFFFTLQLFCSLLFFFLVTSPAAKS